MVTICHIVTHSNEHSHFQYCNIAADSGGPQPLAEAAAPQVARAAQAAEAEQAGAQKGSLGCEVVAPGETFFWTKSQRCEFLKISNNLSF